MDQVGIMEPSALYDGQMGTIQKLLLEMLCEVDKLCTKHQITYFLGGGTLLGSVRNRGFIPWDDDIDVMMLRDDFERFLQAARQELPEHLFLQTPEDEKGCHYVNAKIRLRGTVFCSEFLARFPELQKGIFLDIVAHDETAGSPLGQIIHLRLTLLARGLLFKKWSGDSVCKAKGKKRYFIFDLLKCVLPFSFLEWFQKRVLTMYRGSGSGYLYDGMGPHVELGAFPGEWLSGTVQAEFEGRFFPIPVGYDAYLSFLYGDYRTPEEHAGAYHQAVWVDLGEYAPVVSDALP